MDNESGSWGSRSNEPPKLATVRRLHLDDGEGSSATATEEWYETERLTGQITSRARSTSPTDRTAPSQNETPMILDWRHTDATPPTTTALQRLGQRLGRRNLRGRREFEPHRQNDDQPTTPTQQLQPATLAAATEEPPPAPREQAAAHEHDAAPPSGPRLSLREREDQPPEHPKRRFPRARVRVHRERLDLRRGALASAVLLSVVAVLGIASQMSSTAKPPHTRLTAVMSSPTANLNTAAKTVIGALAALNSQARPGQASHHAARPPQRALHKTRVRTRAHVANSRPEATSTVSTPPAAPASSPSTSSYSQSSSSPAYSQPVSSGPAQTPTSSAPQRPNSQPAFGANGALGPGTGSPGTQ
jgi:hypothetical protein